MQNDSAINDIQAGIMRQLFLHDTLRFAEVNVDNVPSDQFSYHLRQLLKYGLIEKGDEGRYRLSVLGRSRALMLYPDKNSFIEQGFLAVRVVLSKQEDGQEYFLMQDRQLVPYKGTYGIPGDKILFGEDVADAAKRAMREQAGFDCKVALCGLTHYKERYLGRIVQDKFFFVFRATYVSGQLMEIGKKGNKNVWLSLDNLRMSPKTLYNVLDMIEMTRSGRLKIDEQTYDVESY
jgi:ADP-ribose pyrophosphatase YjhB (NUDIX family)